MAKAKVSWSNSLQPRILNRVIGEFGSTQEIIKSKLKCVPSLGTLLVANLATSTVLGWHSLYHRPMVVAEIYAAGRLALVTIKCTPWNSEVSFWCTWRTRDTGVRWPISLCIYSLIVNPSLPKAVLCYDIQDKVEAYVYHLCHGPSICSSHTLPAMSAGITSAGPPSSRV